ncbi:MAG: DUF4038 domain-containing protein, partial [Steroidobacteraceae bacterium]|nr:DUF4038 domain-containing protein [Steroidobacteraceae bacterium]
MTVTAPVPAPTVTLTANPTSVTSGSSSTLSWSSTNATSCAASNGWSGAKATSGTQSTGPLGSTTTYTLVCTGAGGSGSDSMTVVVSPATSARFPLHTETGKRYLVDANGQPFFVHGESAWALIAQLTREEADQYLEDRRLKGFNTVMVQLVVHGLLSSAPGYNPPYNIYGVAPFTVAGDFSTPNEAYFAHAEYVIAKAAEKGLLVLLAPAYMGYQGGYQGWYADMIANGEAKLRGYGRYVANRFRAYDNIVWLQGGDYNPPEKALLRAVANGIRDIDTRWLHTFHGARGTSALGFLGSAEPWLGVNDIYTDENTVVANAFLEY